MPALSLVSKHSLGTTTAAVTMVSLPIEKLIGSTDNIEMGLACSTEQRKEIATHVFHDINLCCLNHAGVHRLIVKVANGREVFDRVEIR